MFDRRGLSKVIEEVPLSVKFSICLHNFQNAYHGAADQYGNVDISTLNLNTFRVCSIFFLKLNRSLIKMKLFKERFNIIV